MDLGWILDLDLLGDSRWTLEGTWGQNVWFCIVLRWFWICCMVPGWTLGGAWDQNAWFYNVFLLVLNMLNEFWVDSGSDQESFGFTRRRVPDTRGGIHEGDGTGRSRVRGI